MNQNVRSHHSPTLLDETRPPLVRVCHRGIFALLVAVLIAAPLVAGHSRPWMDGVLMLLIAGAGALWILRVLLVREAQVVFPPLGAAVLTLSTYVLVRYSIAEVEAVARPDMLLAISSALLFFLVLNDIRHRWHITVLVWSLTGLGVLLSLLALGQLLRGQWPTGPFARPADLAVYLLLILPVVAANFFFSRRSQKQKIAFAFAGLLMCAAFAATRAYWHWLGLLAAFIVVALFVIQKRGWRFRWLMVGGCVLLAVLLSAFLLSTGKPPTVTGWEASPAEESPSVWKDVLTLGQRNLWLGAGPGMIEWLYPAQRNLQARVDRSGSEYINLFVEGGVVGCVIVVWVIVAFIVAVVQILNLRAGRYSVAQQSNRFAFGIAGLAAIAAIAVNAGVDLDLRVPGNTYTLVIILGAVLTCGVHRRAHEEESVHQPGRHITVRIRGASRYVLAAGLGVMVLLVVWPLRQSLPAAWLMQTGHAAAQRLDWDAADHAFRRAWKIDPRNFEAAIALGDLHTARATWSARQRETLATQALSWYQRARTLNPYAYDLLIRIARVNELLGRHDEALDSYRRALQSDPRNASYHAQLGWHYQRRGDHELAQKNFRAARQLGALEVLPESGT